MFYSIQDLGFTLEDVVPGQGFHCSHFFYSIDRRELSALNAADRTEARQSFPSVLNRENIGFPARFQLGLVSGHKADFSMMIMDQDPVKIESLNQSLLASPFGKLIRPEFSYVSISEVSEYALTVDQYSRRLAEEGESPDSSSFQTKVRIYEERLAKMNYQRLTPDFPSWPVSCFYPMNKWRIPGANWFNLPSSERHRMMLEHARSGIKFGGKVSQLITVGIGLDDWEWGVTLWATNPMHLKQIVYEMRFDEASAKYAEFGPFYTSYQVRPEKFLELAGI